MAYCLSKTLNAKIPFFADHFHMENCSIVRRKVLGTHHGFLI